MGVQSAAEKRGTGEKGSTEEIVRWPPGLRAPAATRRQRQESSACGVRHRRRVTSPTSRRGGGCAGGAHMHSGGLPSAVNTHTPPTRRQADTGERNTGHCWCACVARNHGDARETTVLRHSRACEGMRRGSHMTPSQGAGEAASKDAGQAGSRSQVRYLPAVVVVIVVVGCSAGSGGVGECSPRSCTSSCLICTRGGGE